MENEIITIQEVTIERHVNWLNVFLLALGICAAVVAIVAAYRWFRV